MKTFSLLLQKLTSVVEILGAMEADATVWKQTLPLGKMKPSTVHGREVEPQCTSGVKDAFKLDNNRSMWNGRAWAFEMPLSAGLCQ